VAGSAKWVDVFCDRGAFDADQAREILQAGIARGLLPRMHANQLEAGPGVQLAVELDAASADHVTHVTDADVDALAGSRTVATLLPGAEFSTRSAWPDARRLLDATTYMRIILPETVLAIGLLVDEFKFRVASKSNHLQRGSVTRGARVLRYSPGTFLSTLMRLN